MTMAVTNAQGQTLVAGGNPPFTELSRSGVAWNCSLAAAVAPLAAIPTTVAALEIFNNSAGPSAFVMVIDSLFAFELLSSAFVRSAGIWAQVSTQKAAPSFTTLNIFSQSGRPLQATTASGRYITGLGTTVVANGWRPWGPVQMFGGVAEATTPGESMEAPVNGKLEVPPGTSLMMHVVSSLATGTYTMGASWHEISIPNIAI